MDLAIEHELRAERAASLGRAGAALQRALTQFRSSGAPADEREARLRLWYLIVQREALGLRHHQVVYESYQVPRGWT